MLRPVELVKLLMNTAEAVSKVDFSNPAARKGYMQIERTFTEALPMSIKKFMVANIPETPFDNEEVKIMGDTFKLKELVSGMQYGGQVQEMQAGGPLMPPSTLVSSAQAAVPVPKKVVDPSATIDETGAAVDSVSKTLREGDFVLNSTSIEIAGEADIRQMFNDAIEVATQTGKIAMPEGASSDDFVDVLLGDGEIVIPRELVGIIGLDRLEKINNRGKALMQQREAAANQAQEQGPVQ
jgi:hypothetical protein|tara:strand:+ start:237 stop:953 length:717 start_codon:yes stop_codon:yes gene_type:complete